MSDTNIIAKVYALAGVLRDEGVTNSDYLEQLTYFIFLKMAYEYSRPPFKRDYGIPSGCTWDTLTSKSGAELADHYKYILDTLAKQPGVLREIFTESQNKISKPAILKRVINAIDEEQWTAMSEDVKGDIYEGLLAKVAEDTKSGAGQYFTPRALIKAIVKCVQLAPGKTIVDPCCGSGGFLLAAKDFIENHYALDNDQKKTLKFDTFRGWEIVRNTYRLCLMNLFLHNIGDFKGEVSITRNDALLADPGIRFDYVLTNPPFGKKSSISIENEDGEEETEDLVYNRPDFWATGSNKQLNFVQHINTLLKANGTAAVVVPDNVLFESGAGETVRQKLLETTELHTILRLPTGIFYKPGVKANVIFFQKKPQGPKVQTKEVWIYDLRTNMHFTPKKNPMQESDLNDFIACYNPANRFGRRETWSESNPDGRWRKYTYEEIAARDKTSLDIFWIKDKTLTDLDNLPDPDVLAQDIMENLQSAIEYFKEIAVELKSKKSN